MFSRLTTHTNKSPEPPSRHPGAPPDSERTKQPPLLEPLYEPYSERPAVPELPYAPYTEKPVLHEPPYEPYKGI